ncbi:MAG: DNA polymerase III subunit delta' [Nitrospirota bacterium]
MNAPTRFAELVGHGPVIARLRSAVAANRLGSAYLFVGEPDIGKRTLALIWARLIQCEAPAGAPARLEPCGACRSCRQHDAAGHPDVFVLEPEDASVVTIDQVRRLQTELPYRPLTAARRVVLVPEAARLNQESSNGLLKILEEPPGHAMFLLVTAQRDRLLPTILSRCQMIRCAPPPPEAVLDHLTGALGASPDEARRILAVAQGRVGPAVRAVAHDAADTAAFDDLGAPDVIAAPPRVLDVAERVGKDQEALRALLAWLTLWLRDVLAWQAAGASARLLNAHRQTDLAWWADRLTMDDVLDAASGLHALWLATTRNLNPQLAAEVALLNLSLRLGPPGPAMERTR